MIVSYRDEIKEILLAECVNDRNKDNFDMDTRFEKIGIRSIQFIKALVNLEMKYNIEFEDEDLELNTYKTIGQFINKTEEKIRLVQD